MDRKNVFIYILLVSGLLLCSALGPAVIRTVSGMIVSRITGGQEPETIQETETDADHKRTEVSMEGNDNQETKSPRKLKAESDTENITDEQESEWQEEQTDDKSSNEAGMREYRENATPIFSETFPGAADEFLADRKALFTDAVSDYIYSLYGDSLELTRINVIELVQEDDTQMSYSIEVYATDGKKEYSELFISTYSKEWGFYSIYPYSVE